MMKKILKRAALGVLLVLMLTALFGCRTVKEDGEAADTSASLVIIAGRHANARIYSDNMLRQAEKLVAKSVVIEEDGGGYSVRPKVSVIVDDKQPERTPIDTIDSVVTAPNYYYAEQARDQIVAAIMDFLRSDNLRAEQPEVDLLGAVSEAQKILKSDPGAENHILILDSGVSTAGALDMRDINITDGSVDDVLKRVGENSIPDLTGTKVTFYGLGNVGTPQSVPRNDTAFTSRMEELWTALLTARGGELAEEIHFAPAEGDEMVFSEDSTDGYPMVSTVPFPEKEEAHATPDVIALRFYTADLGFKPDSAEFLNGKDQAITTLNAHAKAIANMLADSNSKIYIVGSIAKTTPSSSHKTSAISAGRAQAVLDLLVNEFLLPADRFVVVDAGTTEFPWRNAVEFPDGVNADPVAQSKNRLVMVFSDENTDYFNKLKEAYPEAVS